MLSSKKQLEYNTHNIEISSDSNRENSDEENSNEKKSDEENFDEQYQYRM